MTSTEGTCHKGRGASVSGRWDRVTSGAVSDSTPRTKYTRGMRGQGQAWRLRERGQDREREGPPFPLFLSKDAVRTAAVTEMKFNKSEV